MKLDAIEAGANAALAANEARAATSKGQAGNPNGTGSAGHAASASGQGGRCELRVPYAEKNDAKALGAEWDATRKVWHVATGVDLKPFARWLRN
jgi:DNA helicase-2/ATP-dependent DNA helicase PcrA